MFILRYLAVESLKSRYSEYQRSSRLTWQWNGCTNEASNGTDHFKTNQSFAQEYVTGTQDAEELPQKRFHSLYTILLLLVWWWWCRDTPPGCVVVVSQEKVQWPNFATRCDNRKLLNVSFRVFVGLSARELKPDFGDNNQIRLSTGAAASGRLELPSVLLIGK